MANWTFPSDEEGWTLQNGAVWTGSTGNPAGCLHHPAAAAIPDSDITGLSVAVDASPVSYDVRVLISGLEGEVQVSLSLPGVGANDTVYTIPAGYTPPYDTGWVHIEGTTNTGTVDHVDLSGGGGGFIDVWFDNIYVGESPPAAPQLRYLGIDSDETYFYLTAIKDGDLSLLIYDLSTLVLLTTVQFGTADYGDPDTLTRAIFPVVKPGNNQILFLRGRDGNDVKVQVSDDGGATFSARDDAGWAADKFCVALSPDPLRPDDLAACFADNDLYRSEDEAANWSKTGDSPVTLRTAGRHVTAPAELLLAAQAADSLRFTNNYGASFEDVSETVGTVNVIEVSR